MKQLKLISIPLLTLFLFSCSQNGTSSNNSDSSQMTSSSGLPSNSNSDSTIDSSSEAPIVNPYKPMDEPLVNRQYYLNHIGDIYNTWNTYRGKGITIAVIDVGFMANHPDFTYSDGTSKVSSKSAYIHKEGNTIVVEDGTVENLAVHYDADYNNDHGTFCAGVAAAGLNGKGVIGIAPEAELMLLRTDGHPHSINKAFTYAADNGAKVITISIGSYNDDYEGDLKRWQSTGITLYNAFDEAVQYCRNKNVAVISAAGNGGVTEMNRPEEYTYPGATTGVIGVGGLMANESTRVWSGSSYNSSNLYRFCDVFAPSDGMYGCCEYSSNKYDGGYDTQQGKYKWRGTSFASPIVAGMAALYFEKNPNATVSQFEDALFNHSSHTFSDTESGLTVNNIGYGRVDIGALLNTTYNGTVTIKVEYNGSSLYAFGWNDAGTISLDNREWPGKPLTKVDGYYQVDVNYSEIQNILFNNGGNSYKTINLSPTSFIDGDIYSLNTAIAENSLKIGTYK